MRKNYFFTLLLTFLFTVISYSQVTDLYISKYGEGSSDNKFLEIYNGTNAAISLADYAFPSVSNGPTNAGEYEFWNKFPDGASIAAGDVYVIAHPDADQSILDNADHTHQYLSNGDDGYALVKGGTWNDADSDGIIDAGEMTGFTILDWLGDWQADPGSGWDVAGVSAATKDHTLTRKSSVCGPNNDWDSSRGTDTNDSEWIVGDKDSGWDTLGSYTGCVSEPVLTITAPSDNSTISSTTSATVSISVSNFTVGAVNGNSVDGHIHWTVQKNSESAVAQPMKYNVDDEIITVEPGNTYTVFMQLVDNSHTPIDPAVSATTTFTVDLPCDIQLATISTSCETSTSGTDTYTTSIDFTAGNTTTYTITAKDSNNNDVGTIGGDNPSTIAAGTITITGVPEGTDFTVKVIGGTGSSCDLTRNISSPNCIAFPVEEYFDYPDAANLGDQASWTKVNSGDEMLIATGNLDYTGLKASTGNKVTFDGTGSETYTTFPDITSGTIYASFLLKVTAFQTGSSPDLTDGGYIAALAGETSSYDARLWVRPNPDTSGSTFDIGFGYESSSPPFTTGTYNLNDVIFVVMAYNMDNATISTWVNPDASSFEGTIPTATITTTDTSPPSAINLFILRQDSTNETPSIEVDELRISTSWADVTPKEATASTINSQIEGFAIYPNPVTNGRLSITSNSSDNKQVSIFNVLGKNVLNTIISGTKAEVNTSGISAGIYILKVVEGGKTATSKLIIR